MSLVSTYSRGAVAANRDDVILRDREGVITATTTPVIYCHHATGGAQTAFPPVARGGALTDQMLAVITERMTTLGHPLAMSDQAGDGWGNDASQTELTALLARVAALTGCNPNKVLLLADSMGTTLALNWARANPTKVAALALLLPIPDLAFAHADPGGNVLSTGINTAYGGAAAYATAEPTHNPSRFASAYKDMHLRLFYCDDDAIGLKQESLDFAAEIAAAGGAGSVATFSMGNHGHALHSSLDTNLVTDFLHAHA